MTTLTKFSIRQLINLTAMLFVIALPPIRCVVAEEQSPIAPIERRARHSVQSSVLDSGLHFRWTEFIHFRQRPRIEMPRRSRVSHSLQPLRRVTLLGGDRFLGELLKWDRDRCSFRLLTGQTIHLPKAAIALLGNPPGEVDLIDQSFEGGATKQPASTIALRRDDAHAPDGASVLVLSGTTEFQQPFPSSPNAARIEFSFEAIDPDPTTHSGEWTLSWASAHPPNPCVVVRVGPHRQIHVSQLSPPVPASVQTVTLSEGWHSFIALVTPDRTRLIVDEAILATFATPDGALNGIRFEAAGNNSKNSLQLDAFQVRRLGPTEADTFDRDDSVVQDVVTRSSDDQLFGRVLAVNRDMVRMDAFGEPRSLPWTQVEELSFAQSLKPVRQTNGLKTGVVATVQLQPFADRPECEAERWNGTIFGWDVNRLVLHHSLAGTVVLNWNEIRRIDSQCFGNSLLIDARRFHLGNSIRSDFHRHRPDGTECQFEALLTEIPGGPCHLVLDVAELEAAGPDAPPASPFLAELREGHLTTELLINNQSVGDLNSRIRFRAPAKNPDRVRLAIPRNLLKIGSNSIRLKQRSRKESPREFDDCEIGNVRLEFGSADTR